MKKNIFMLFPLFMSLVGCSINDFIRKTPDTEKLYIGGYPIVKNQNGETFDYHVYLRFISPDKANNDLHFDYDINLNEGVYHEFGNQEYGMPKYSDINYLFLQSHRNYSSINEWFMKGNMIEAWTGCGKFDNSSPFVSTKIYINGSGKIISLSTISAPYEKLNFNVSFIYKEAFDWGIFK